MNLKTAHILRTLVFISVIATSSLQANARTDFFGPGLFLIKSDTSRYPLVDRRGDPYTYQRKNTFDFNDTAFIRRSVEYDPKTKQYYIIERIGNTYYRTPTSFSMEEFVRLQGQRRRRLF